MGISDPLGLGQQGVVCELEVVRPNDEATGVSNAPLFRSYEDARWELAVASRFTAGEQNACGLDVDAASSAGASVA